MKENKLIIEPLTRQDLPFLNEVRNLVREYLHDNREFSLDETNSWFRSLPPENKYYLISICREGGQTPIGYFRTREYIMPWVRQGKPCKCLEIGADLHPSFEGKGYAYRSYIQFLSELEGRGFECVSLQVLGSNSRAFNLYVKLGFVCGRSKAILRDGKFLISIKMEKWF